MMKRAFWVGLSILGFSFPLGAETNSPTERRLAFALYRPEIFNTVDGLTLIDRLPVRSFLDGTRLPFSTAIGRMGMAPLDLPPVASLGATEVRHVNASIARRTGGKDFEADGKDSPGEVITSGSARIYAGGEVGVFYGQWSGKYSGDALGSYIQSSVGTDKFQINVGAAYQEWNVQIPHGRH